MKNLKFKGLLIVFSLISGGLYAQNRTANNTPTTGNKETVFINYNPAMNEMPQASGYKTPQEYARAKQSWIAANPEKYRQNSRTQGKITISKNELDKMPSERAAIIRNNPDKYEIK